MKKIMTPKKTLHILLAVAALSCSESQPATDPYPNYLIKDEDWIVYEGTLPTTQGPDVHVELSLFPGAPGLESRYRILEYPNDESQRVYAGWIGNRGKYMLLSSPEGLIIHIPDRSFVTGIKKKGDFPIPEIGKQDLYLKIDGEHKLIFLDENLKELAGNYHLIRRTSPLFTVEGYFSVYSDTTDFYERNTTKEWAVAELAAYSEAVKNYDLLSREKFEGVYLKALAYTVSHADQNGEEIDVLVFKKILQMDSTARVID
jgi:hypothetical protein